MSKKLYGILDLSVDNAEGAVNVNTGIKVFDSKDKAEKELEIFYTENKLFAEETFENFIDFDTGELVVVADETNPSFLAAAKIVELEPGTVARLDTDVVTKNQNKEEEDTE